MEKPRSDRGFFVFHIIGRRYLTAPQYPPPGHGPSRAPLPPDPSGFGRWGIRPGPRTPFRPKGHRVVETVDGSVWSNAPTRRSRVAEPTTHPTAFGPGASAPEIKKRNAIRGAQAPSPLPEGIFSKGRGIFPLPPFFRAPPETAALRPTPVVLGPPKGRGRGDPRGQRDPPTPTPLFFPPEGIFPWRGLFPERRGIFFSPSPLRPSPSGPWAIAGWGVGPSFWKSRFFGLGKHWKNRFLGWGSGGSLRNRNPRLRPSASIRRRIRSSRTPCPLPIWPCCIRPCGRSRLASPSGGGGGPPASAPRGNTIPPPQWSNRTRGRRRAAKPLPGSDPPPIRERRPGRTVRSRSRCVGLGWGWGVCSSWSAFLSFLLEDIIPWGWGWGNRFRHY